MTTTMQIGETARDRADFCRCFKTGAAVFLHDDGIVAHSTYRNTLRAAYMLGRTNCTRVAVSLSEYKCEVAHPFRDHPRRASGKLCGKVNRPNFRHSTI